MHPGGKDGQNGENVFGHLGFDSFGAVVIQDGDFDLVEVADQKD